MKSSKGTKKIIKQFKKFVKSRYYRKYIQYVRQALGIPTNGLILSVKKKDILETFIEPPYLFPSTTKPTENPNDGFFMLVWFLYHVSQKVRVR
jgi:hypothetical protein